MRAWSASPTVVTTFRGSTRNWSSMRFGRSWTRCATRPGGLRQELAPRRQHDHAQTAVHRSRSAVWEGAATPCRGAMTFGVPHAVDRAPVAPQRVIAFIFSTYFGRTSPGPLGNG